MSSEEQKAVEVQETVSEETASGGKLGYLGKRKIKFFTVEGDMHNVVFEDDTKALLHKTLYAILLTETPVQEDLTDLVYNAVALMFYKQCSDLGLMTGQIEPVANYLLNNSINKHNKATSILWGGKKDGFVTLKEVDAVLEKN